MKQNCRPFRSKSIMNQAIFFFFFSPFFSLFLGPREIYKKFEIFLLYETKGNDIVCCIHACRYVRMYNTIHVRYNTSLAKFSFMSRSIPCVDGRPVEEKFFRDIRGWTSFLRPRRSVHVGQLSCSSSHRTYSQNSFFILHHYFYSKFIPFFLNPSSFGTKIIFSLITPVHQRKRAHNKTYLITFITFFCVIFFFLIRKRNKKGKIHCRNYSH